MAGRIERSDSIDSACTGIALNQSHHESSKSAHLRLVRSPSVDSIRSDSTAQPLRKPHWTLEVARCPSTPCLYEDPDRMRTEVFSQNNPYSYVSSPGPSHENYDIFIPEAYRTCDDDERAKYEEFIDEVFKPLMEKHNLKWYCFRTHAPLDGTVNSIIREAQAQCCMSLIVLCKAIIDSQNLQMLGAEHVIYLQIDKNIKVLPGVLLQPTILRFVTDKERKEGMTRIKLSIDRTKLARPMRGRMDRIDSEATSFYSSPYSCYDDIRLGQIGQSRSRSRSTPEFNLDDEEYTSDPYLIMTSSPIREQAPIQRPPPCMTSPPNIATKVTTEKRCADEAMGSFDKVHHPRTNAAVFVSSDVEKKLWRIEQDEQDFLKGDHDQESIYTQKPDYILRFVIPSALSKETRQYLALAYLATDSKYPTVVKQALFGLWEMLVLRPRQIDETFVSIMVSVEAVLRPRGDTSRWTVNADIAILFIELYQMVISFIFLGFLSETTVQIPRDDLEAIRTGVAKLDRLVKDTFASLQTKFQYFRGKIIDPCIESMIRKVRTVLKRPKKTIEARRHVITTIHRLMQPELDTPQRANVVKLTMQQFGNLREHGQITVFLYCCLLTRDMETELRVSFDDILKQMAMALLKNMPEAVMQGLVFRCYGCEMASHVTDDRQQDSSFISLLEENVPVISPLKKKHHKAEITISTMFLMKLLFHSDERLRNLLAKRLLVDDSTANKCIQQPSHDISNAALVLHVEASLRMYGLELKVGPQIKYAATFSRLWPNDGTSFVYFHGSFGDLSPNILCKMVKMTRRGHLIGSDDSAKMTQTIQAEINALKYVHQRRDACDHILEILAFNAEIRSGPLFYIVKCSNEQNLSSHLKGLRDKPNRYDVFKLDNFCLGALLALQYCKENKILVTSATAASFLLHQEGQSYIPKLALQEGCIVGSLEHIGEKHDRVPVEFSAPETLLKCSHSTKSMAYLTSMILFEILSLGVHPFQEIDLPRGPKILQILKYRLKPERRRVIPERLYIGLSMCWFSTPDKRASIEDLHSFFEDFTYKHKHVENSSFLPDQALDTMWSEECDYLNEMAWKQPSIPNLKQPTELENLHRFPDLWTTPDEDKEYIQYCCGSEITKCSPNELTETDDPMKIKAEVGYWSCPLKLRKPNIQAISKLQDMDHANVSKVDLVQRRESRVCINTYSDTTVIEFMTGRHLPEPERIKIYKQMVDGVNYVHKQGFVHCHISPKAFYINPESHEVRLGNLGRCTLLNLDEFDEDITQAMCRPFKEIPRSSWRWLPMETLTSHCYRTSTDVFSLGLTIWVLETANCHASRVEPLYSFAPFSYRDADDLSTVHLSRHTLPRAADCPLNLDKLIQACTSYPACCRPITTELVAFFAAPQSKVIILPDDPVEPPNDCDTPYSLGTETTDATRRRISRMLLQSRDEQYDFYTMDARQYTHSMLAKEDFISPIEDGSKPRLSRLQTVRKSIWKYFGKKYKKRKKPLAARSPKPPPLYENISCGEKCNLTDEEGVYEDIVDIPRRRGSFAACSDVSVEFDLYNKETANHLSRSAGDVSTYEVIDDM